MKMRFCWGVFALALGAVGFVYADEETQPWRAKTDILVTSFGAKGDGITDDTAALQRAADALAEVTKSGINPFWRTLRNVDRPDVDRDQPRLVFPKGVYRLTAPVIFRHKLFAAGEGAGIVQEDPTADAFYVQAAFICRVSGFSFKGGRSALRIATHNTECANIRVADCSFNGTSDAAIECKSFRAEGKGDRKQLAFGEWKWNPETKRNEHDPRWEQKKYVYNNSTFFLIENCRFDNCRRAADVNPDGGMIRDCLVRTSRTAAGGAFRLADVMHVMRVKIFIQRNPNAGQSAFELYNDMVSGGMIDFWAEDSVLKTDDGRGAPFVECRLGNQGYIASMVVLENISTETPEGCGVVRIKEGPPPSIVALMRVQEKSDRKVQMMTFDQEPTEELLLAGSPTGTIGGIPPEGTYSFSMRECGGVLPPTGAAARYMRQCPEEAGRDLFPEPRGRRYEGEVLYATDFGVDLDPKTDDTEALQRFVARLSEKDGAVGVLPAVPMRLGATLPLRGRFCLVGAGVPIIETTKDAFPMFTAEPGAEVLVRDLQLRGGESLVTVPDGASVRVEGCFIYDPKVVAIRVDKGGRFAMDGCVVYASHLYTGEGEGFLGSTWFRYLSPNGPMGAMTPGAAIVNRGRLQAWDILGVPVIYTRYKWNDMGKPTDIPDAIRWVDNFGEYYSRGFRYGGERGGVTPAYHHEKAMTAIEGSYAWFETFRTVLTPILSDCEKPNARLFAVACSANRNVVPELAMYWRKDIESREPLQKVADARLECVYPRPKED